MNYMGHGGGSFFAMVPSAHGNYAQVLDLINFAAHVVLVERLVISVRTKVLTA